ncbi:MAG: hypothetical protein EX272_02920 [Chromatiales bacterium]|nr:MAG: hypothetical protein EX272_02920 [Chromatiales bacterium]
MIADSRLKTLLLVVTVLTLSACGGGGGSDNGGGGGTPTNRAPTANAGAAQSVNEFDAVTLDGSASSDPDAGTTLTYSWTQTLGANVTLSGASTAAPTFDAPDVTALNTPAVLRFQLTVSDGSLSSSATVDITVNDAGLGINSPPTAAAGPDQNVAESSNVDLDGSGSSDPDGDMLSYSWIQTGGQNVTLTGANTAQPSFTSPNVAAGSPETLTFELTVDDGADNATDSVDIVVAEAQSMVSVSGRLFYELPTANLLCRGYDFNNLTNKPVRRATVQLLDAANTVLATGETGDDGSYSFAGINANTDVRVRVTAEMVRTSGAQTWEVYVRDNTSNTAVPFGQRPIYEVQWGLFNTGTTDVIDQDFVAATGWGGAGYTGARAAAPLSILDAIADAIILIQSADANVDMGRLDAYWSVNNTLNGERDWSAGELSATFFVSSPDLGVSGPAIFLLGDAVGRLPESTIDTDEFDRGVLQHEWGHYFEHWFSRSDSIGGRHFVPGTVEPRLAFGEGWGYAISAIIGGDPLLCDTFSPATSGFQLDIENEDRGTQGFFNEMSVATLIYDLYDTSIDGTDIDSIGFAPIYETMTGFQKDVDSFTTVFSFAEGLLANVDPADIAFVNSQLSRESVDTGDVNRWATGQTTQPALWTNGKPVRDILPVYTELTPGGASVNVCVNDDQVIDQDGNKPGEWRYFRFTTSSQQTWTITAAANPVPPPTSDTDPMVDDRSDPDLFVFRNGAWLTSTLGRSPDDDVETISNLSLSADTYTIAFQDWRYEDPQKASDYPSQVCFDVSIN